jgi:hypothetical protein
MNLLSLVGPWLDNICQIRRKWYYLSGWNFLQSNMGFASFHGQLAATALLRAATQLVVALPARVHSWLVLLRSVIRTLPVVALPALLSPGCTAHRRTRTARPSHATPSTLLRHTVLRDPRPPAPSPIRPEAACSNQPQISGINWVHIPANGYWLSTQSRSTMGKPWERETGRGKIEIIVQGAEQENRRERKE